MEGRLQAKEKRRTRLQIEGKSVEVTKDKRRQQLKSTRTLRKKVSANGGVPGRQSYTPYGVMMLGWIRWLPNKNGGPTCRILDTVQTNRLCVHGHTRGHDEMDPFCLQSVHSRADGMHDCHDPSPRARARSTCYLLSRI